MPNFYIWLSMCGQRHKRLIQCLNYIWFAFMKLSHNDANFAIKTCHLSIFSFTCTNHLKTLSHKIIFWGEQIFVTNLTLNPPTINVTNFAIPWFLYIKSYNRVQKYLWPIFAQFDVFLLNPKPFYIHFDKFWTSFIYILSHILGWTYKFQNMNFIIYCQSIKYLKNIHMFHGQWNYHIMQVLHLYFITLFKLPFTMNVTNSTIPSFTWINMYGMIYWTWTNYVNFFWFVWWLMKLSQWDEGITITLQKFVQVTLYHQCCQYCNTLI